MVADQAAGDQDLCCQNEYSERRLVGVGELDSSGDRRQIRLIGDCIRARRRRKSITA